MDRLDSILALLVLTALGAKTTFHLCYYLSEHQTLDSACWVLVGYRVWERSGLQDSWGRQVPEGDFLPPTLGDRVGHRWQPSDSWRSKVHAYPFNIPSWGLPCGPVGKTLHSQWREPEFPYIWIFCVCIKPGKCRCMFAWIVLGTYEVILWLSIYLSSHKNTSSSGTKNKSFHFVSLVPTDTMWLTEY